MNYESVILRELDKYHIPYQMKGKNISDRCIGVCCPFCGDDNFHVGIFKDSGFFSCFRCNVRGNLKYLIYSITGVFVKDLSFQTFTPSAVGVKRQVADILRPEKGEIAIIIRKVAPLPTHCYPIEDTRFMPTAAKLFLDERRLPVNNLLKFDVMYTSKWSDMKFKLVFPIFENRQLAGWIARDVAKKGSRYVKAENMETANFLYNYDSLYEGCKVIVCEGVTDVLKLPSHIGYVPVGIFTNKMSSAQKGKLLAFKPKAVIMALDSDAKDKSKALAEYFRAAVDDVKYVEWGKVAEKQDVGMVGTEVLKNLKKIV